jgi:hypothetical protein
MSESYPRPNPAPSKPLLTDGTYNVLKWATAFVLPALSALYVTLGQLWDFPKIEEVVGTITAFNTFLGGLLAFSTKSYNNVRYDGDVEVSTNDQGTTIYGLELNRQPESFNPSEMIFRVVPKKE